jgi:hypothetical protein
MLPEEQLAAWFAWKSSFERVLERHTEELAAIRERIDGGQGDLLEAFADMKNMIISKHDYPRRREEEIIGALDELFDKVWYNRHLNWRYRVQEGQETVSPELWKLALKGARRVERKYGKRNLGPWDDFEWGMLNGKLSALRWVLGDEWDMLDT